MRWKPVKIKQLLITIITLGLNLLLNYLKSFNTFEKRARRKMKKLNKKKLKVDKNFVKDKK